MPRTSPRATGRAFAPLLLVLVMAAGCGREPYPRLAALKAFIDSNTPQAAACLRQATLIGEAWDLLKSGTHPIAAHEQLAQRYAPRTPEPEEQRKLDQLLLAVTAMASGFQRLRRESAVVGYMQLCRAKARADGPDPFEASRFAAALAAAEACERAHTDPGERKECVVTAFGA